MNNYEKYYRRSYNALKKLIEAYNHGYDINNMKDFRAKLILEGCKNQDIMKAEQLNLMFTITVALMGLNKESIENTGKVLEYKRNINRADIRNIKLTPQQQSRINKFDQDRIISTDFDDWLSISINPGTDVSRSDFIRRVRNGLLHSNFYIEDEFGNLDYTHIKTKSYYQSQLLNVEFERFIFEYFSNIVQLGLTEKMYTYNIQKTDIHDKKTLRLVLEKITINRFIYDNLKNVGKDTPELILTDIQTKDGVVDIKSFVEKLKRSNNFENVKVEQSTLGTATINFVEKYIETNFGDKFYKLDWSTQSGLISTLLQFVLNPKNGVSNWLIHFWYLYNGLTSEKFDISFFTGDEFGNDSCYPSLLILKAYLVMYRLQNNNFDSVDYNKVNIDLDGGVQLISGNDKNPEDTTNTFIESIDKELKRGNITNQLEGFNKVICEVVRNSLAHGNVIPYIDMYTMENKIELTDIDKKSGKVRILCFKLSSFEKFLNSEAFLPKNCYRKTNQNSVLKKKLDHSKI